MSLAHIAARIDADNRAAVQSDTWGHLAPATNTTYRGHIIFALGIFGNDPLNPTVLECELKDAQGAPLESSPWVFDAMTEYLGKTRHESGHVYRWEGSFRNYVWRGKVRRLELGK